MDDYMAINRANWDERAPVHATSPDYAVERFVRDPEFLSGVVSFDRPRLGDIDGLTGVHLQCHIGTDTISLARLGASMTGLDFSAEAFVQARALAERTGSPTQFVEADLYRALDVLPAESFDLVYTGIGALCWLPDITRWAEIVATLLRPGGRLFIRELHPMLATLDEERDELLVVKDAYFARSEPNIWTGGGTYVETDHVFATTTSVEWSHGLGETVTALLEHGLRVTQLAEHDSVPWPALPSQMTCDDQGEWRLTERPWRLAASFTVEAFRA